MRLLQPKSWFCAWLPLAVLSLAQLTLITAGCGRPSRPGFSEVVPGGSYVRQSENPNQSTKHHYEETVITTNFPTVLTKRVVDTEIGAAHKDMSTEIKARMGSMRSIQWLGAFVFLFGIASIFWLPLKAVIGSVTTSAAIACAGLLLVILPTLIVGNELLILGGCMGGAILYWFAYRHSKASTIAKVVEKSVDTKT